MEGAWKGRGDECALAISPAIKLFLSWSPVNSAALVMLPKGTFAPFVKRQNLYCKRDLKRSGLVIHIGACQRLFKWPVI